MHPVPLCYSAGMAGKKERKFKRNIFNSYHPTVIEGEYMLHLRLPDNKNKLLGRAEASDDGEHLEQAEDTQFDEKSHYAYAVVTRTFAPHGDMHFQEFLIDRNANYRLEFTPYRSKSIKRKTNPDFVSDFDTPDEKPTITYLKENETPGDLIREDGQKLRPKERLQGEGVNRAIQLLHDATPQLIGAVESMRETKDKPTLEALTHRAVSRGTHIQHRPIADAKDIQPRQFTPPKKSDPRAVVKQLDKVGDHRAISPEDMKPKRLGAERTHVLDLEVDTGKALEDARQKY
ncbi:MAG: hypothetical protein CMM93_04430, partial [Rickettsiales bacterium]|nr:hypothetical protein [Rickettsiales bacterium]